MEKHRDKCGSDILSQISILDAIYWLNNAWNEVEESTISKCFANAGFINIDSNDSQSECDNDGNGDDQSDIEEDDIPLAVLKQSKNLFGCEFHELVNLDNGVNTCDESEKNWDLPASELLKGNEIDSESDSESEAENEKNVCSVYEAKNYIQELKFFAMHHGMSDLLSDVMSSSDKVEAMLVKSVKQKTITDFFA